MKRIILKRSPPSPNTNRESCKKEKRPHCLFQHWTKKWDSSRIYLRITKENQDRLSPNFGYKFNNRPHFLFFSHAKHCIFFSSLPRKFDLKIMINKEKFDAFSCCRCPLKTYKLKLQIIVTSCRARRLSHAKQKTTNKCSLTCLKCILEIWHCL